MVFRDWAGLVSVLVSAVVCYPALVTFLRLSGKRTLAKLNAFDLVVTVALGSTLATMIVSRDVPIVEGLAALVSLIVLQFVVASASIRSPRFRRMVKSEPRLLFAEGRPVDRALREERVTVDELRAAARSSGAANLDMVRFIVLETDGALSVIPKTASGELADVAGA